MKILPIILLTITLLSSGCATTFTRVYMASGFSDKQGLYPATKFDTEAISSLPTVWKEDKIECIVGVPFVLLDYPFSITSDTLLLPWDIYINLK